MKATGKTCGGNDGCGKPKRQGFPQPWKSLRDSHIPTARLLLYIFPKPIPKGVFLTACTFSLQAHSSIRKDYPRTPALLLLSSQLFCGATGDALPPNP